MSNLRVGDSAGPNGWGPGDPAGGVTRPTPGDKQPTWRQGIQFINIPVRKFIINIPVREFFINIPVREFIINIPVR